MWGVGVRCYLPHRLSVPLTPFWSCTSVCGAHGKSGKRPCLTFQDGLQRGHLFLALPLHCSHSLSLRALAHLRHSLHGLHFCQGTCQLSPKSAELPCLSLNLILGLGIQHCGGQGSAALPIIPGSPITQATKSESPET